MTQPAVGAAAQQMYDSLPDTWRERDDGSWLLLALCAGLSAGAEERWALLEDPGPRGFFDPETVPAKWLPLMAARNGARLTPGMAEAQQRAEVANPTGWRRGLPSSILSALSVYWSPGGTLLDPYLMQRTSTEVGGDQPAHVTLRVREADLFVGVDTVRDALKAILPVGMFAHVAAADGWIVSEVEASTDYPTIGDLESGFADVGDFEEYVP